MKKNKRAGKLLTPLEKRCLMKWFLKESCIFFRNCDKRTRGLGIEKAFEEIEQEAESRKPAVKIKVEDENNFAVLFDENEKGNFKELFRLKNGFEVVLEEDE